MGTFDGIQRSIADIWNGGASEHDFIAPPSEALTTQQRKAHEKVWRERRETYISACRVYGAVVVANLGQFVAYRLEVAQAQVGGRRLRRSELADFEHEAAIMLERLRPELQAEVGRISDEGWLACAPWFRGATFDAPLPPALERAGQATAKNIHALLADWGLQRFAQTPDGISPHDLSALNPLNSARWQSAEWAEAEVTRHEAGITINTTEWRWVPTPIARPWLTVSEAARLVSERDVAAATRGDSK